MSFTNHLRQVTSKISNKKCVDLVRTRLNGPIRNLHTAHTSRILLGRAVGSMDISSETRHIFHSSSYSEFRSSPELLMPVRRRRRGTARKVEPREDDSEESDGTTTLERLHAPVTDQAIFDQESCRLLDKIEKAMEPMKVCNEIFITKREDGERGEIYTIDLGAAIGIYQVEISQDEHVFEYSSPVSGKLLYCLSSATGEWVNIDDGHQFEGILVRDLLRSNCIGLPKL